MALMERGHAQPPNGKGRAVLSVRSPSVENLLAGINIDGINLDALRAFSKALMRDRNEWDIARRGTGLFQPGQLRRSDADRQLRRALASMEGGSQ